MEKCEKNKEVVTSDVVEDSGLYMPSLTGNPKLLSTKEQVLESAIGKALRRKLDWLESHPEYMICTRVCVHGVKDESKSKETKVEDASNLSDDVLEVKRGRNVKSFSHQK